MKKTILGLFAFVCAFSGVSCSEDDLSGTSVIKPEQTTETPLDAWLYKNYIEPYNIEFRYRYEDMESDMIYDLTPANYEKSVQMAKLVSLTASSPSTATTTTPAGTATAALSEATTVLATTWPKMLVITTFLPAAPAIVT